MNVLIKAAQALIDSIADDNGRHGGLLSRETTRKSDELRVIVNRILNHPPQGDPVNGEPKKCEPG